MSDSAVTVAQAILSYRNIRAVPASTDGLLDTLGAEIGTTPLADINYRLDRAVDQRAQA
jgi:hypothetical protein